MQRPKDQLLERLSHLIPLRPQWRRRFVPDSVGDGLRICAVERHAPRKHFVEHDAKRPQVAARIGLFAPHLLGRHVGGRAERRALEGELQRCRELRQAEVEDLDGLVGDDQVAWLDIAVDDALRVGLGEPLGHLRRNLNRGVDVQPASLQLVLQRLTVVVRHDDEQAPIVGRGDVVNGADVTVIGGRRSLGLADEPLLGAVIVAPLRWQELQRNQPSKLRVARRVNDTHPAAADFAENFVLGNRGADQRVDKSLCQEW